MRWNDIPLLVTATGAGVLLGVVIAWIALWWIGGERVRVWLAGIRGGTELACPCCGRRTIVLRVSGRWRRMPPWLEHDETSVIVCSASCAAVMGDQRIDRPRLTKAAEAQDVVRWVLGVLPEREGLWIGSPSLERRPHERGSE